MRSSAENRDYYRKNKDEINRRKREKYREDKEYRDAAKARSKNQTLLKKLHRINERATVTHNGRVEKAFTLTELCREIDRSRHVVFHWRYAGIMPKPTHFIGDKGIYSESQLKLMKYLFGMADSGKEISYQQISTALHRFWKKTFTVKALSKGAVSGKGKGKTGSGDSNQGREGSNQEGRAGSEDRRPSSNRRSKSGGDSEHGKLRSPAPRRELIIALQRRSSQGRRGF